MTDQPAPAPPTTHTETARVVVLHGMDPPLDPESREADVPRLLDEALERLVRDNPLAKQVSEPVLLELTDELRAEVYDRFGPNYPELASIPGIEIRVYEVVFELPGAAA